MPKFKDKRQKHVERKNEKSERIPDATINYYRRVSETLSEEFTADTEEKDIFLTNVFNQFAEDGLCVFKLSVTSRLLEKLVAAANVSHLTTLLNLLKSDWSFVITDRFASHVLQNTVERIPHFIHPSESRVDGEGSTHTSLVELFLDLCEYLKENFSQCWTDTYGSHIVRMVLQVLGGHAVDEQVIRSRVSRDQQRDAKNKTQFETFTPPEKFKKILKKFTKLIFQEDNLKELSCLVLSNPVIQTVLLVLHHANNKSCQKYLHKLVLATGLLTTLPAVGDDQNKKLPEMASDSIGSFLVEQIINLASEQLYMDFYKGIFKGRLLHYGVHPGANFILQRLISNVKEKEHFEEIFSELCPVLEDFLAVNHFGVITKLAEGCIRLGCKQEKLVKSLMTAFHCVEPVERQVKLASLLLSMTTYDMFHEMDTERSSESQDTKQETKKIPVLKEINYHGSLLLQQLLRFGNPKIIVTGLLALKPVEFHLLSCDPKGSHVIDVFFQSLSVGEKSRDLMLNRMKGSLNDMACNRNGSRTLENVWKSSTTSQKMTIAEEISKQEAKIRSDQYGHFIHRKFGISQFLHRRNDWKEAQTNSQKKRKLFQDILSEEPKAKTAKTTDTTESTEDRRMELQLDEDDDEPKGASKPYRVEKSGKKRKKEKKNKKMVTKSSGEYTLKDKAMQSLLSEVKGEAHVKKKKKLKK